MLNSRSLQTMQFSSGRNLSFCDCVRQAFPDTWGLFSGYSLPVFFKPGLEGNAVDIDSAADANDTFTEAEFFSVEYPPADCRFGKCGIKFSELGDSQKVCHVHYSFSSMPY